MKKYILLFMLASILGGCAASTQDLYYRFGQERKLSRAVTLLEKGETAAASQALAAICAEPMAPGVTDEALFRLSLLQLGTAMESAGRTGIEGNLEKLVTTYPSSSWTPLASSLIEFFAVTKEARSHDQKLQKFQTKENRKLKEQNLALTKEQRGLKEQILSLTKENSDLRQIMEKLKTLELDLGKRPIR
jgi:hypothetical protein